MKQSILQEFLPLMRNAVVATIDDEGQPHQTPAAVYYDGESYYLQTAPDAQEVRNLQRDPRLSLCIAEPGDQGKHMTIRGSVIEQRIRGPRSIFLRIAQDND
jgi:general stress protein 26